MTTNNIRPYKIHERVFNLNQVEIIGKIHNYQTIVDKGLYRFVILFSNHREEFHFNSEILAIEARKNLIQAWSNLSNDDMRTFDK